MEHVVAQAGEPLQFPFLWLIPAVPLLGAAINGILGYRIQKSYGTKPITAIAVGSMLISAAIALIAFFGVLLPAEPASRMIVDTLWPMISINKLVVNMSFAMDPLSGIMTCVVTGIGAAIHVYSAGYMHDEKSYWRYFCYLNLFCFSMLLLVLGDNFLLMFFGWEGVGLCSYLLIGFWYTDVEKAKAGMKAFVVNRVGDWGFICGLMVLFWGLGGYFLAGGYEASDGLNATLTFRELAAELQDPAKRELLSGREIFGVSVVTLACIGFFIGACGKSAQIPLYIWLPDAMAGPTPVSALIHAATMVTAGVYMVARLNFLFAMSPVASTIVASVGALTAIAAATIGLFQYDIKKVLAYSTVSQLGYMFMGVGVGAYWAGMYHVFTHAFFKACLFLGSGSVIHAMHWVHHRGHGSSDLDLRNAPDPTDPQDMRNMGGLAKLMPITHWTYLASCLAIAGIPIMSGFYSKDAILASAYLNHDLLLPWHGRPIWALGMIGAVMTSFYMFRSYFLTFHGRGPTVEHKEHVHESPRSMSYVLVALAVGAFLAIIPGWFFGMDPLFAVFLDPVAPYHPHEVSHLKEAGLILASLGAAGVGIYFAYQLYYKLERSQGTLNNFRLKWDAFHKVVFNKYYVDEAYKKAVVDPTVGISQDWARFDLHALDWAVNYVAVISRFVARVSGWLDFWIVDGLVNKVADWAQAIGERMRRLQTGRINNYAYVVAVGAVVVLFVTYMVQS